MTHLSSDFIPALTHAVFIMEQVLKKFLPLCTCAQPSIGILVFNYSTNLALTGNG